MPLPQGIRLPALLQALQGVLADGLQHPHACLSLPRLIGAPLPLRQVWLHQAVVDERPDALHVLALRVPGRRADGGAPPGCSPRRTPTGAGTGALGLAQQVAAPVDRAADGLLAGRQVAGPAAQQSEAGD